MDFAQECWYGWPWVGLGMAIVALILLFGTNLLRGVDAPRWRDPYWLAWVAFPAYLVHQFEEYALHITDGQFDIISQVFANAGGVMDLSNLPMLHFPLVNITLVWVGVPLAAWLGRKLSNPVVALAPYGFVLVNGVVHCMGTLSGAMPVAANPGFFTGTFVFLPLCALVIAVCVRGSFMRGGGLALALGSGAIAHGLLGAAYALSAVGPAAVIAFDVVAGVAPALLAYVGCKLLKVRY
ncbi:MAG: HXXEE domain-containing protein [Eggerthellaceae bacterium]